MYLLQKQAATEFVRVDLFYGTPADQLNGDHLSLPQEPQETSPQATGRSLKTECQREIERETTQETEKPRGFSTQSLTSDISPIRYYQKIRWQLWDNAIDASHQLIINRRTSEVRIGFKSAEERQRAVQIIRINYFSREQFKERWF